MNRPEQPLWPYSIRTALIAVPLILIGLILLVSITRAVTGWPTNETERFVVIGIFIFSLVPLILLLIDGFAARGALVEFAGLKLSFSQIAQAAPLSPTVPTNIGVTGHPIGDSGSTEILDGLRRATANEVVVIDLEEGQAWWETRLLVLLSGATRLGTPRAIVFVATESGKPGCYHGWGYPKALLRLLVRADPLYERISSEVQVAANQWTLLELPAQPKEAPEPTVPIQPPPVWLTGLASQNQGMAFKGNLPNPLAAEQLLASELSVRIEQQDKVPRTISTVRLKALFVSVLNTHFVDQNAPPEQQVKQFFVDDATYVAVTRESRYLRLVPRAGALSEMVAALVGR